jgi:hypothetical protein
LEGHQATKYNKHRDPFYFSSWNAKETKEAFLQDLFQEAYMLNLLSSSLLTGGVGLPLLFLAASLEVAT